MLCESREINSTLYNTQLFYNYENWHSCFTWNNFAVHYKSKTCLDKFSDMVPTRWKNSDYNLCKIVFEVVRSTVHAILKSVAVVDEMLCTTLLYTKKLDVHDLPQVMCIYDKEAGAEYLDFRKISEWWHQKILDVMKKNQSQSFLSYLSYFWKMLCCHDKFPVYK